MLLCFIKTKVEDVNAEDDEDNGEEDGDDDDDLDELARDMYRELKEANAKASKGGKAAVGVTVDQFKSLPEVGGFIPELSLGTKIGIGIMCVLLLPSVLFMVLGFLNCYAHL